MTTTETEKLEPGTALERAQDGLAMPLPVLSDEELHRTFRIADALAKSGFFKDAQQATQAFAKILFGRDLGLSPTEAMTAIHIIEGRPEASADLQATKVQQSGKYRYRVTEHDREKCVIEFQERVGVSESWEVIGVSEYTIADARDAGLAEKGVWKKHPRNMLFARAMSNGCAWYCPEVMGGLRLYHDFEMPRGGDGIADGLNDEPDAPANIANAIAKWAPSPETCGAIFATLVRAQELGHAGLANYATAELSLKGQPVDAVWAWVNRAKQELDALDGQRGEGEPERVQEAEVVEAADEPPAADAEPEAGPSEPSEPAEPVDAAPGAGEEFEEPTVGNLSEAQREALVVLLEGDEDEISHLRVPTLIALERRGLLGEDGLTENGREVAALLGRGGQTALDS